MRTKPIFEGAATALVTPLNESGVNYAQLERLINWQIDEGINALVICGTTGEAATMSPSERLDAISFCCEYAYGRVKVIAGTGSNGTENTVSFSKEAQRAGADALLVVTPYYNKPTQSGLLRHYTAVTEQVDVPVLLYNVPSRTGVSFTAETYRHLSENPQINGVKEASGDFALISETRKQCGDDFYIWSGNDDQVVPMMSLGCAGVISVAGNLVPEKMARLTSLCLYGKYEEAASMQLELFGLIRGLFCESNPIPVKTAMNLMGFDIGPLRLPLCEMSEEHIAQLKQELLALKIL